jgi:hypothetical protein
MAVTNEVKATLLTDCEKAKDGECRKEKVRSSMVKVGEHDRGYKSDDTGSSAGGPKIV